MAPVAGSGHHVWPVRRHGDGIGAGIAGYCAGTPENTWDSQNRLGQTMHNGVTSSSPFGPEARTVGGLPLHHRPTRHAPRGFSLIELLVVVAIIGILSAILFPVFARARERARQTQCLSNMRQLGLGLQMYIDDWRDRCFFFGHDRDLSRLSPAVPLGASRENRWWNQIAPYTRGGSGLLECPSDPGRKPHPTEDGLNGRPLVPRSYVANRVLEGLTRSQVDTPAEVVLVAEKGSIFDDSWYEPPKNLYNKAGYGEPVLAMKRHGGGCNCVFFDSHAAWLKQADLMRNPCGEPYSGVHLMRQYPIPGAAPWCPECPR